MLTKHFNLKKRLYSKASFGFLFDIDGVFLKGKSIIPEAKRAFNLLLDRNGKWKVPAVFVTNAGNKLRKMKAADLSEKFAVNISPDQVVMSHSPLRMFSQFHNKYVLVCGQGHVNSIAKMLGFTNAVTCEQIRHHYPQLDVCDHNRRKPAPCAFERYNKSIEAIVLFGEPTTWETHLQILLDMLMTNGQPYRTLKNKYNETSGSMSTVPYPHIPLLACNMDMQWMAEAPLPRIGHGCFLLALESLYEKLSGRKLLYTTLIGKPSELTYHYAEYRLNKVAQDTLGFREPIKTIYCVGDNPQTDIYGANLYNRYLEAQQGSQIAEEVVKTRRHSGNIRNGENKYIPVDAADVSNNVSNTESSACKNNNIYNKYVEITGNEKVIKSGFAEHCKSILVLTGVIRKDSTMDVKSLIEMMSQSNVNHNHRDFPDYPELKVPTKVVHSVAEAVLYVYDKEKYSL